MIGKTISHYTILEKLGDGGMGEVFLAEDTKLKRKVALKFLPKEFSRDPEAKKRFMEEARSSSHLDHNNICVIHDIKETDDGQLFIIMNYCQGETLQNYIKEKELSANEILKYITQIAKGLEKAHSKGIVHCDIKPTNIIITNDGVAKIVDFGIAKIASEEKLISKDRTSGTTAYMSPEQMSNASIDARTDIWSLGILFYEMLTKQRPFQDIYNEALMYSIVNEEPKSLNEINPDVPIELEKIVLKMLAKDPKKRYQSISNLLSDFKKYKKGRLHKSSKIVKPMWRITAYIGSIVILGIFVYSIIFNNKKDDIKSIAVLPFTTIDRTEEGDIFSTGMHDDILSQLSKIGDLKVISRTSVMRYKDTNKSIKEIAQELGVETILEGSVRRVDNKVRIVAQLIHAKNDNPLWAETYDREYADIFAIQTDVAENIASALKATMTPEEISSIENATTKNMEAYDYYQKGNYYLNNNDTKEGNENAILMYEKAIEIDSNFATAYALISIVQGDIYSRFEDHRTTHRLEQSKEALNKALLLQPNNPIIHSAKGNYYWITHDFEKSLREFELALKYQPNNSEILSYIGSILFQMGIYEKGIEYLKNSYELDPKGINQAVRIALYYQLLRNWVEAERWAKISISIHPDDEIAYIRLAGIYAYGYGDLEKARWVLQEGLKYVDIPERFNDIRWEIEIFSKNYQKALEIANKNTKKDSYIMRGTTLSLLNESEKAIANFEQAKIYYERLISEVPDVASYHSYLGLAYAGLGQFKDAVREGKKATEITPVSKSFYMGPIFLKNLSQIYISAKDFELAIDQIEYLLSIPCFSTRWTLLLDPQYDPISDHSQFQEFLNKEQSLY